MQIKGKLHEQPECTSLIGPSPVRSIKYKTWGWLHQHVYWLLLLVQIPKAQKDSQVISVFCTFGIWVHKSCT